MGMAQRICHDRGGGNTPPQVESSLVTEVGVRKGVWRLDAKYPCQILETFPGTEIVHKSLDDIS